MNYDELVIGKEYWCEHPFGIWEGPIRLNDISDAEMWLEEEGERLYFHITVLEEIIVKYQTVVSEILEKGYTMRLTGGFKFTEFNISLENE